jgi:hypothetical protein
MSYLLQYARRPASIGRRSRAARLDETTILNRPDFDGGACVRCFVEDTTRQRRRRDARIRLEIADCANSIYLEFRLDSPEARENALFKAHTLIAALHRFRDALAVEAELAAGAHERREEA